MDSGHLPPFCRFPLRRGFYAKAKSEMQYCGYSFGVGISLVGIAIPNHFRNPGISGMKHCRPNLEISYMVNLIASHSTSRSHDFKPLKQRNGIGGVGYGEVNRNPIVLR